MEHTVTAAESSELAVMLEQAAKARQRGQASEAEALYRAIVLAKPDHAEANYQLGLLAGHAGNPGDAIAFLRAALRADPGQGAYWFGYIDTLLRTGRLAAARLALDQATAMGLAGPGAEALRRRLATLGRPLPGAATPSPVGDRHPTTRQRDRLVALFNGGSPETALRFARCLAERAPDDVFVWLILGLLLMRGGRFVEAVAAYDRALALTPGSPDLLVHRAAAILSLGRPAEAVDCCDRALAARPDFVEARYILGNAQLELGLFDQALSQFDLVLIAKPTFMEARNNRAVVLDRLGRLEEAQEEQARVVGACPGNALAKTNLASMLSRLGRLDEALACYGQAMDLCPEPGGLAAMGSLLTDMGRLDEAEASLRRALALRPGDAEACYRLGLLGRLAPDEPDVASLHAALDRPGVSESTRMFGAFTLAKLCETRGEYDRAFAHYTAGHRSRRRVLGQVYDPRRSRSRVLTRRLLLDQAFFRERRDWGGITPVPVFVVGFPRSGTTLVEQILSSHSLVHGAGERWEIERLAMAVTTFDDEAASWEALSGLTRQTTRTLAETYLRALGRVSGGAYRCVDKMPHNYKHLWLIALLFPRATILHCRRRPEATCLSCYVQNFTESNAFADDLVSLGWHYRCYQEQMEHWRQVLPVPIHDVVYEDMVADPEAGIRRLLGLCGLPFEAGCLAFHETKRPVRTASSLQVRQKIYRDSLEKWRRYEPWLEPLRRGLAGEMP